VGFMGKVLRKGKSFGEDIITKCKRDYTATALTFLSVFELHKNDLFSVISQAGYEIVEQTMLGKARWMRLKKAVTILGVVLTRLRSHVKNGDKITLLWYSSAKEYVLMRSKGEADYMARTEHLSLLQREPKIKKLLRALTSGEELPCNMESTNFHRAVPVGEMSSLELRKLMQPIARSTLIEALQQKVLECLNDKRFCKSLAAVVRRHDDETNVNMLAARSHDQILNLDTGATIRPMRAS